jgi:succinate dehydrogenase/fumarate reductase flavoprotein subunit
MVELVDTDVLVIGGGAAGCTAAMTASDHGAKVTMLVKGLIGRSGCSIFAGTLDAPPKTMPLPLLSALRKVWLGLAPVYKIPIPKNYRRFLIEAVKCYMHYLVDQDYVLDAMIWAKKHFFTPIEATGLYLLRDSQGKLVTNLGENPSAIWAYKMGFSGVVFMQHLRKQVAQRRIKVLEETSAISFLTSEGRCVGALALDYARGKLLAVRAKATILATGNTNWLAKRTSATREQAANGFGMAYRAGADLHNMEIQWWHASDTVNPRSWMRLHNYPNSLPGTPYQGRMVNSEGQVFFDGTWFPTAVAPYFQQLKKLNNEVKNGHARWDGGFYMSYEHIDPTVLEKYQYHWGYYKKIGLDMSKDRLESAISWHMTLGGIRASKITMETKLPALFVAGGVGGHYLGGLPFVCYDGTIAGTYAAKRANDRVPELDWDQINTQEARIKAFLSTANQADKGPRPLDVKAEIRELMWCKMGFVKNVDKMNEALGEIKRIREETLPKIRLGTNSQNYNYDLIDALDLPDMLDSCEMAVRASLVRQDSRGPFYREEYPYTDNKNWLKYIIVSKSDSGMSIATQPVKCTYIAPENERDNYFETDY